MLAKTSRFIFALVLMCQLECFCSEDPLPSWNEGAAKKALTAFVQTICDPSHHNFVPTAERIATFDLDGTLIVEQPAPPHLAYCWDVLKSLAAKNPELKQKEPFKTALSGGIENIYKLSPVQFSEMLTLTNTGMEVGAYRAKVKAWLSTAKQADSGRLYTVLSYKPMSEVLRYFRTHGFKTYIVSGGEQEFTRVFTAEVFGFAPEQVIGTAHCTKFTYDGKGKPLLTMEPSILLNDNREGKVEGIQFVIGRRAIASCGNSIGDQQMLEYTSSGSGARLAMLILHDDAIREYAYGPALGLSNTRNGIFTQALYDEAKARGWIIASMKNDWKQIFNLPGEACERVRVSQNPGVAAVP